MALSDLKSEFGLDNPAAVLADPERILAYFEGLREEGAGIRLASKEGPVVPGRVESVDEASRSFRARLARPLPEAWVREGEVALFFTLDQVRLLAFIRILEAGGGPEAHFALPGAVGHAERRGPARARFGCREKAQATLLDGFPGDRGARGPLLDLSKGGFRMRVEEAVALRGRKPLPLNLDTFTVGTRFPVVRLDQLPFSPVLVCAGVLTHATTARGGLELGMRFEGLGPTEDRTIAQILARRLPRYYAGFPERRRGQPHPGPAAASPEARKEHVRILLAMEDDLDRAVLRASLNTCGFPKVLEAGSMAQALEQVRLFPMDAVILSPHLGALPADVVLARLRHQGRLEKALSILLARTLDVPTRALAQAARIDHLQGWEGAFDEGFRMTLEELLGV